MYAETISTEAQKALKKLVETSELKWLFMILPVDECRVSIIDIDYENGKEVSFYEALSQMKKYLIAPLSDYGLTKSEAAAFEDLLTQFNIA